MTYKCYSNDEKRRAQRAIMVARDIRLTGHAEYIRRYAINKMLEAMYKALRKGAIES